MNSTRRICLACLALLALGFAVPAAAAIEQGKAGSFIQSLGNEAISTLTKAELSPEARESEFRRLLRQGFAIDGIAKFVLGRYWRATDEAQRRRYLTVFESLIVKTYAARFEEYAGETFHVTGERPDGNDGRLVDSEIEKRSGPPIKLQWRVRQGGESLKIVDIVVEGVSMAITQRSEFAAVVQQHGGDVEGLIKDLEAKVGAYKK